MNRDSNPAKRKDPPNSNNPSVATKGDKALASTVDIKEAVPAIENAKHVLGDVVNTLRQSKKWKAARDCNDVIEYLDNHQTKLQECGKALCPLPSTSVDYAMRRMKNHQKSAYAVQSNNVSPADAIREHNAGQILVNMSQPARKTTRSMPTNRKSIPIPINTIQYSRVEFLRYLISIPDNKRTTATSYGRGGFIMEAIKQKYIPVGRSGAYAALSKFLEHQSLGGTIDNFEDEPWNTGGGPVPLLDEKELVILSHKLNNTQGESEKIQEVEDFITQRTIEKNRQKGITVLLDESIRPTRQTVQNYYAYCSMMPNNHLVKRFLSKLQPDTLQRTQSGAPSTMQQLELPPHMLQ